MKTPLKLLFEHYQPAVPQLDRIREAAIATSEGRVPVDAGCISIREWTHSIWQGWFLRYRRAWRVLVAIWIVTGVLRLFTAQPEPVAATISSKAPRAQTLTAITSDRQQLRELLGQQDAGARKPAAVVPNTR